jgi:hypothetical protein
MNCRSVTRILAYRIKTFLYHNVIHILYVYFDNFMMNNVKKRDFNPTRSKGKIHCTALDKEGSEDGLLTKPKLVPWKTCLFVVQDCVF